MNTVHLIGRLSAEPEIKQLSSGDSIVRFSIAISERYKDAGEWKERANFFDCSMFGKRGEAFARFHSKGSQAAITGRLRQERWDDKTTGAKRSRVVILVDDFVLVGGKREDSGGGEAKPKAAPAAQADDNWAADFGDTPF